MKTHADEPVVVRLSPIVHATEQLKSLVDKGVDSDVVLDVSDLGFATSMLINELLELRASVVSRGHQLVICCLDKRVRGILTVTGLEDVFTIVDSQAAALAALKKGNHTQARK